MTNQQKTLTGITRVKLPNTVSVRRLGLVLLVVVWSFGIVSSRVASAQSPENVVLVVNASSPESLAVANQYVNLRKIPPSNVVYLESVKILANVDQESSHSKYFQSQIINPVMEKIKQRGLESQIDCIVYSAGFPTRFNFKPELDKYLKNEGLTYDIHYHAPWASITSLTYFHENAFSAKPDFLTLDANRYANPHVKDILSNPFSGVMAGSFETARQSLESQNYADAIRLFSELVEQNPDQVVVRYFLARSLAGNDETENAVAQLSLCRQQGWSYRSLVAKDPAFANLKQDAQFRKNLDDMLDLPINTRPSRSFSSRKSWAKNGWPNGPTDQGRRYMLSTVLAVTGEGGSTLEQALAQIETSVEADGSKPQGLFFFAKHNDPRSKTRHSQFDQAATELRSMGYQVEISEKRVPQNEKRIIGATLGSAVVDWEKSKSKFVPGALCDNFTSYGAWWPKTAQTQVTEFLNAGAAGACGTVYEPYTISQKIPDARLHVHYARGCTLAEAFYQSVEGPFQLLIVGDPLCCPFGEFPKFEVKGLETRTVVKNNIDLKLASQPGGPEISHFEIFLDGRFLVRANEAQPIRIETDDMSDGYHDLRIVAVSRSLVATRSRQRLEFFLRQNGQTVKLNIEKKQVRLGEPLVVTANSTPAGKIEIRQNSRVLGTLKSDGELEIDSADLGQGKSNLWGFLVVGGRTIASVPVEVEVLP